jgi:hypothetical protein
MESAHNERGEARCHGPRLKIARNVEAGAGQPYAGDGRFSTADTIIGPRVVDPHQPHDRRAGAAQSWEAFR